MTSNPSLSILPLLALLCFGISFSVPAFVNSQFNMPKMSWMETIDKPCKALCQTIEEEGKKASWSLKVLFQAFPRQLCIQNCNTYIQPQWKGARNQLLDKSIGKIPFQNHGLQSWNDCENKKKKVQNTSPMEQCFTDWVVYKMGLPPW